MKLYQLRTAESFKFVTNSGNSYLMKKGEDYSPVTLADAETFEELCKPERGAILVRVDPEYTASQVVVPPRNVKTIEEVLPNYQREEPSAIKFAKTDKQFSDELSLAKSQERLEAMANTETKKEQALEGEIQSWLNQEALATVNSALTAITDFLEDETIELSKDQKIERVRLYIADDSRKTLHTKVEELISTLE